MQSRMMMMMMMTDKEQTMIDAFLSFVPAFAAPSNTMRTVCEASKHIVIPDICIETIAMITEDRFGPIDYDSLNYITFIQISVVVHFEGLVLIYKWFFFLCSSIEILISEASNAITSSEIKTVTLTIEPKENESPHTRSNTVAKSFYLFHLTVNRIHQLFVYHFESGTRNDPIMHRFGTIEECQFNRMHLDSFAQQVAFKQLILSFKFSHTIGCTTVYRSFSLVKKKKNDAFFWDICCSAGFWLLSF